MNRKAWVSALFLTPGLSVWLASLSLPESAIPPQQSILEDFQSLRKSSFGSTNGYGECRQRCTPFFFWKNSLDSTELSNLMMARSNIPGMRSGLSDYLNNSDTRYQVDEKLPTSFQRTTMCTELPCLTLPPFNSASAFFSINKDKHLKVR